MSEEKVPYRVTGAPGGAQESEDTSARAEPTPGPDLNRALCLLLGREQYPGLNGYRREAHGGQWCVPWDDYSGSDAAAFRLIVELQRLGFNVWMDTLKSGLFLAAVMSDDGGGTGANVEARLALCRAAWLALTERKRKGVGQVEQNA